jgi:uroporphyrinogen decarboxylase
VFDWNMDVSDAISIFGKSKTLQGNLDPCVLYGDFGTIYIFDFKV